MSFYDNSKEEARYVPTSRNPPAPACMAYPGAGPFRLASLTLRERHEGPLREREHRHEVYHLVLFAEADNAFILNGKTLRSYPGLCVLTGPADTHSFPPLAPGVTVYHAVTFAFEAMTRPPSWAELLGHYTGFVPESPPGLVPFPAAAQHQLPPLLAALRHALPAQHPAASLDLHLNILRLLALLADVMRNQARPAHAAGTPPEVVAREHLDAHYARGLALAELAAHAGITPAHLGRAFKRRYGISPGRYRDRLRLEAACTLLRDGDLLVKEIAYQLGYPDAYTFSKAFRRHHRCAPHDYRRRRTRLPGAPARGAD